MAAPLDCAECDRLTRQGRELSRLLYEAEKAIEDAIKRRNYEVLREPTANAERLLARMDAAKEAIRCHAELHLKNA
ncbi:MAG TPA: hypothetical protein VN736_10625 [Candidatus Limnocylindrales bacterium]|nr:hypothetical protein [Candidatus Limnocylindrales bacterium]